MPATRRPAHFEDARIRLARVLGHVPERFGDAHRPRHPAGEGALIVGGAFAGEAAVGRRQAAAERAVSEQW